MKIVSATIQNSSRYVMSTLKNTFKAVLLEKVGSGQGSWGVGFVRARGPDAHRKLGHGRQSPTSAPCRPIGMPQQQLVHAGVGTVRGLVRLGHAGTAHWDGDVMFGVHRATAGAGRRAPQHHSWREDRCAAKAEVLLTVEPSQAASAQAVGFGQVPWKASGVVGNPADRARE